MAQGTGYWELVLKRVAAQEDCPTLWSCGTASTQMQRDRYLIPVAALNAPDASHHPFAHAAAWCAA